MFRIVRFRRDKEAAYATQQQRRCEDTQRWLLLGGGIAFALLGFWLGAGIYKTTHGLTNSSVALLLATLVLWGLTFTPFVRARLEMVPIVLALVLGWFNIFLIAFVPEGGSLKAALLFGALAALTTLMAPMVQTAVAAMIAAGLMALVGFGVVFPLQNIEIGLLETVAASVPMFLFVAGFAFAMDHTRREAFSYKHELGRRATTDEISGVSNRAHIHQVAQNEFGRARRYKEPLSMVMVEIDHFDTILDDAGPIALDTMIQVFAGYCVVVMRHCDSFGRLSRNRFLAILPETPIKGAKVLGERMCRDLAALDVLTEDGKVNFTVSIGMAEAHPSDKWGGDLLRRCGQAVDDAIERGRNTFVASIPPALPQANDAMPVISNSPSAMMPPPAIASEPEELLEPEGPDSYSTHDDMSGDSHSGMGPGMGPAIGPSVGPGMGPQLKAG